MDALQNLPWFQTNGWMISTALLALAVAMFAYVITSIALYPRQLLGDTHPFELQRRSELRAGNFVYRFFEPLVEDFAVPMRKKNPPSLDALGQSLLAAREKLPWKPEEFIVTK